MVHFHINDLCQYTTAREVDDALKMLHTITPAENPLHEMYDRVIGNIIQRQHPSRMKLANRILSWLVAAKEVLQSEELRMAIATGPNDQDLPSEGDMPDNTMILEVCGGLVVIDLDEITAIVRLAHYSVQEYLLQSSTSQPHLIILDFLVTYLCFHHHKPNQVMGFRGNSTNPYPWGFKIFPDLYLLKYFHQHLKACDERSSTEIYLNLKLLRNKNALAYYQALTQDLPDSRRWSGMMDRWNIKFQNAEWIIRLCCTYAYERMVPPLLEASFLGHLGSVKALLEDDRYCNLSAMDNGMTALHHAAFMGHDNIIDFLLEHGQDFNSSDKYGRTPLALALVKGHEDTARLLLKKGATPVSTVPGAVTPLHIAAYHGLGEIALLLIHAGADVNAEGIGGMTPLHLAISNSNYCRGGGESMVELLLDHGGSKHLLTILETLRGIRPNSSHHHLALRKVLELLKKSRDKIPEGNVVEKFTICPNTR